MDGQKTGQDATRIMHEIGKLTGAVDALIRKNEEVRADIHRAHREQTDRINALRDEVARMVQSSENRMDRRIHRTRKITSGSSI